MRQRVVIPLISKKPSMMLRITADEDIISEFFVILLRELGVPPRIQIDISQNMERRHTAYAVISVDSEEELERKKEEIERILTTAKDISWDIIKYRKYGNYYIASAFFEFIIETIDEPTVMMGVTRYLRAIEKMTKDMGSTAYKVMFVLGTESGNWIVEKYGESLSALLSEGRVKDVIEFVVKILEYTKNIPLCEISSDESTLTITFFEREYRKVCFSLAEYVYGVLYGLFKSMDVEVSLEKDERTSRTHAIKVLMPEKEVLIKIDFKC